MTIDTSTASDGEILMNMDVEAGYHWFFIDDTGTFSFSVDPAEFLPTPGVTNNLAFRIYGVKDSIVGNNADDFPAPPGQPPKSDTMMDLSIPLPAYKAVYSTIPAGVRTPASLGKTFKVATGPFFIKVLDSRVSTFFTGTYNLKWKKNKCTSVADSCALLPSERLKGQTIPVTSPGAAFYDFMVAKPDGLKQDQVPPNAIIQTINIEVFESIATLNPNDSAISRIDVLDAAGSVVLSNTTTPPVLSGGFLSWRLTDSTGILTTGPLLENRFFLRVTRKNMMVPTYTASWSTDLTYAYGKTLGGGEGATMLCKEEQEWGSDELYINGKWDDAWFSYPSSGFGSGNTCSTGGIYMPDATDVDSDDYVSLEWIFHNRDAYRYVRQLNVTLCEDDSLSDEFQTNTYGPLADLFGRQSLSIGWPSFHSGEYAAQQPIFLNHSIGRLACESNSDCDAIGTATTYVSQCIRGYCNNQDSTGMNSNGN